MAPVMIMISSIFVQRQMIDEIQFLANNEKNSIYYIYTKENCTQIDFEELF